MSELVCSLHFSFALDGNRRHIREGGIVNAVDNAQRHTPYAGV